MNTYRSGYPEPLWVPELGSEARVGEIPFRPDWICLATGLTHGVLLDGTGRDLTVPLPDVRPAPADCEALLRQVRSEDDPLLWFTAEHAVRCRLLEWLNSNFQRAAGAHAHRSTSSLRAEFEREEDCSVTGGEMKGACLHAGFTPVNRLGANWTFAMRRQRRQG